MTVNELDRKLNDALVAFSDEIRSSYSEGDKTPVTEDDIVQLSRQVFYTLDTFREQIVSYLSSK